MVGLVALLIQRRHWRRRAAGRWHLIERTGPVRREHDDVGGVPGAAARERRIADDFCRTAGYRDRLELAARKEANPRAIGRPERLIDAVAALDPASHRRIERADPQLVLRREARANRERDRPA